MDDGRSDPQAPYDSLPDPKDEVTDEDLTTPHRDTSYGSVLDLPLDAARLEVAEHRNTIRNTTEKLQQACRQLESLSSDVNQLRTRALQQDAEIAACGSVLASRDSLISQLQQACRTREDELRQCWVANSKEIEGLKSTISSHLEVIITLGRGWDLQQQRESQQVEQWTKQINAAVSSQQAAEAEAYRLDAVCRQYRQSVEALEQEKQTLESDFNALLDVNAEVDAKMSESSEENQRLKGKVTQLQEELETAQKALRDCFPGLQADLSNLAAVLRNFPGKQKKQNKQPKERHQSI